MIKYLASVSYFGIEVLPTSSDCECLTLVTWDIDKPFESLLNLVSVLISNIGFLFIYLFFNPHTTLHQYQVHVSTYQYLVWI